MRNLKRALSLAVASVMLLGMMVVGSGASYADVTSEDNQEAIAVLQAVGIMTGDDQGNFNPDANVTRGEMAVIMSNLLDLGIANYSGASIPFTDVPDWAAPYVAACYANGITGGTSATTYGTDEPVTAVQAGLMMLKALGYFQYQSDFGSSWILSTITQATKCDLYDGIDAQTEEPLTRNEVAQLALNALETTMVETDGQPNTVVTPDGTTVNIGSVKYIDVVRNSKTEWNAIDPDKDSDGKSIIQLGEDLYDGDLKKETETDDLGRPASVWSYKGTKIGKYADEVDYTIVVDESNDTIVDDLGGALEYIRDMLDNDDVEWADDAKFAFDGEKTLAAVEKAMDRGTVVEVYVDDDDNDIITHAVAYYYSLGEIDEIDTDVSRSDADKGIIAYVTIEGAEYDVDISGFNPSNFEEGDYVVYLENPEDSDKLLECYAPEVVEGSIDSYKAGDLRITMDGTQYYAVSKSYTSGALDTAINDSLSTDADDAYALYLDKNGMIVGIDATDATASIDDVYYLVNVWSEDGNYGSTEKEYYAQVVTLDGVVSEIELEDCYDKDDQSEKLSEMGDNYDSILDQFYTISDKKQTSGSTTTSKSGNDKYNLEAWPNKDEDEDWDKVEINTTFTDKLSSGDTRWNLDEGTYRLNSETSYIVVEESGSDLEATVKTGGLSYSKDDLNNARAIYIITEDGSKVAKYVVIATDESDTANAYSEDVLFIKSDSSDKGDGFRYQDVYWADGTKETIQVDEDEYSLGRGFYTYDTNSDGYYVLDEADPLSISFSSGKATWDDEDGVIVNATFVDFTDDMLTVKTDDGTIQDIDVTSDVVYKDIHSTATKDGQYDRTVNSLKALDDGIEDERFGTVTLSLNVSEDGVVSVFVTDIAKLAEDEDVENAVDDAIDENVNEATDGDYTLEVSGDTIEIVIADGKTIADVKGTGLVDTAKALVEDGYEVVVSFGGEEVTVDADTDRDDFADMVGALEEGENEITVTVSKENGSVDYTILVTVPAAE